MNAMTHPSDDLDEDEERMSVEGGSGPFDGGPSGPLDGGPSGPFQSERKTTKQRYQKTSTKAAPGTVRNLRANFENK